MIIVDSNNRSIGITLKNSGCIEDFVSILLSNGYWVKRETYGEKVTVYIKEV